MKKSYECVICFQSFEKQTLVNKHLKLHLQSYIYDGSKNENTSDSIPEDQLKMKQNNTNTPKKKLENNHEKKNTPDCLICCKSFGRKYELKKHIATVHEGVKPFKCSNCDVSFSRKNSLTRHIASTHAGKKPLKCSICDALLEVKI